ncbi:MAG: ABC transporter permease subunit [Planctomycetota bacterium]|nr:ABC transporter permease subunit [Planctomycetota bacterium]
MLLLGILLVGVSPLLSAFALGDEDQLLVDISLSTMLCCGLLLGAFTAASNLGDEIRRRTVMVLLSKPVTRTTVLLGKFTGIAFALTIAQLSWMATLLLALRHRTIHAQHVEDHAPVLLLSFGAVILSLLHAARAHRKGRSFPATLSRNCACTLLLAALIAWSWAPDGSFRLPWSVLDPNLIWAMVLVHEGVLILGAVALAASTRLPTPATIALSLGTLLCGVIVGSLTRGTSWSRWIPDLQRLWISDGLIRGGEISVSTAAWASLWALLTLAAVLSVGAALFARRDVS